MFEHIRNKFRKSGRKLPGGKDRGQSLVEMAVIVPLLLFIFLGLMEVGWAIRGYLILLSTNRETARFGARGDWLNFEGVNLDALTVGDEVGYNVVLAHTYEVLASNELAVDLTNASTNGAFILSHYLIDTGKPCDIDAPGANGKCLLNASGDCRNPADRRPDYPYDDSILYPGVAGYDHFIFTQGMSTTTSRIDAAALAQQLKEENDVLNCQILQRNQTGSNPVLSSNSIFVVEAFYEQPQLLGVPLLSNTFTDPIGLYNQTKMRISTAKFPQGAGCELFPVALNLDNLNNYDDPPGQIIPNIRNAPPSDNQQRGYLRWNGTNTSPVVTQSPDSEQYLNEEVDNMRLSMTDYIEPGSNPQDTQINAGDRVAGITGEVNGIKEEMEAMVGRTVTVPVWSSYSNGSYVIAKFVRVRIQEVLLTGAEAQRFISAVYIGEDPNCSLVEN